MLAVTDGSAAIEFYKAAFGAQLLWKLGDGADIVAGLSIDGAPFFLAYHAPEYGTRAPSSVGFTTVRIELFVENPAETEERRWKPQQRHIAPSKTTTTPPADRSRFVACCKALWSIPSVICG
jgi:uncharacterized glyoxalase superfamily protein PhnB